MNVQPIDRANLVPLPTPDARASASQARETLVQQVAALARQLADVRAVFAHAHIPTPKGLEQRSDTWRQSWRTFEVCATSADQVIQLTRGHVERTTAALWRVTERLVDEAAQAQQERLSDVRSAFAAMHEAQAAYWQATQQVHRELVALVQAPLVPPSTEVAHGAH
jgi:hypothetical protein